jgi:hypothetical protein
VSNTTDQITGSIADNLFESNITTDLAVNSGSQTGNYTLVFPHTPDLSQPQGDGYGTATVDANGNVKFAGALGDGTPVSQGTKISQTGKWPFFVSPYGGNGSASGVLTFESNANVSDLDGTVYWFRTTPSTQPISTAIAAVGSIYSNNGPSNRILTNLTGQNTFEIFGIGVSVATSPVFTLNANNTITLNSGNALTMTFNLTSGLMNGTFVDDSNKTYKYNGVVFQTGSYGDGLFKIGNTTGFVFFPE